MRLPLDQDIQANRKPADAAPRSSWRRQSVQRGKGPVSLLVKAHDLAWLMASMQIMSGSDRSGLISRVRGTSKEHGRWQCPRPVPERSSEPLWSNMPSIEDYLCHRMPNVWEYRPRMPGRSWQSLSSLRISGMPSSKLRTAKEWRRGSGVGNGDATYRALVFFAVWS